MRLFLKTENKYLKDLYSDVAKNHDSDSGFDLYVPWSVTIPANAISYKLDLEIKCCMEDTTFKEVQDTNDPQTITMKKEIHYKPYMVFPRSSMAAKTPLRLGNSIGLIDKDYRGNIMLILDNISDNDYIVEKGSRLAQIVAFNGEPFNFKTKSKLNDTERGSGGLGSTGS